MPRKLKVYIDTSVIGGCLDPEFRDISSALMDEFRKGTMKAVVSEITMVELMNAPPEVRKILETIPKDNLEHVEMTEEASVLANRYISEGVLGKDKLADAQHIAIATVNKVDIIVSWNFKHIVNIIRIKGYNSVNLRAGYPMIEIRSPREVVNI
jgi:predicted nucleic acid-binding protein